MTWIVLIQGGTSPNFPTDTQISVEAETVQHALYESNAPWRLVKAIIRKDVFDVFAGEKQSG